MDKGKREIWFRGRWKGWLPIITPVHWLGWALQLMTIAAVVWIAIQKPGMGVFLLAALACVAGYWMTLIDHIEWDRRK